MQKFTDFKDWFTTEIPVWKGTHYILLGAVIINLIKWVFNIG